MKTVQKISAIAIALLMIASVIPTAFADPWGYMTTGGAWGTPQIVVGADAAAMDVVGAINMAYACGATAGAWNLGVLDTEAIDPATLGSPVVLVGSNRPVAPTMNPANRLVKQLVDEGKFKDFAQRGAASIDDGRDGVVEIVDDAFVTGQQAIVVAGVARQGTRMACMQAANDLIPALPPTLYTTTGTNLGGPGIERDIRNFLGFGPGAPTEQGIVCSGVAQAIIEAKKLASPNEIKLRIRTPVAAQADTAAGRKALEDYIKANVPGVQGVTVEFAVGVPHVRVEVNSVVEYNAAPTFITPANLDPSTKQVYLVTNRLTTIDQWGWSPPQTMARQVGYNAVFADTTAGREDMDRAAYMLGALTSLKSKNIYNTNAGANLRYPDLYSLVFDVRTPTVTPGTIIIIGG